MPARRDGASQWRFRYRTKFEDLYGYSNGPRASPVIDGDRVFTVGAEGKLHCLDLETGDVVRKQDFWIKYGVTQEPFGMASTPLVEGGLLVVNVGGPRRACVVGLDTATGREAWRAGTCGPSYASPIPATGPRAAASSSLPAASRTRRSEVSCRCCATTSAAVGHAACETSHGGANSERPGNTRWFRVWNEVTCVC